MRRGSQPDPPQKKPALPPDGAQPGQLRVPIFGNRLQLMVTWSGSLGQVPRVGLFSDGTDGDAPVSLLVPEVAMQPPP